MMTTWCVLLTIAFFVNFLGGIQKTRLPRFSSAWFSWTIGPFIALGVALCCYHATWLQGIVSVVVGILGHRIGSKLTQNQITLAETEKLQQIGLLQYPGFRSHVKDEDVAVVLMNMGGPVNLHRVEPFLRRLFNDSMILRFPFAQSFFADVLIRARLKEVEERYALIGGGSPLLKSSVAQMRALREEFKKRDRALDVYLGFNYSEPLPHQTIAQIQRAGKKYILPLSLYPHYSFSTTASNVHYLKAEAKKNYPSLEFLQCFSYHTYDGYIQAFVDRIHGIIQENESLDDFYILFSAHGTPLYFVNEGDPYAFLVSQSIALILNKLNRQHQWSISYQSAVGPLQWLKPSTDDMLNALARRGVTKLIVVPISFVTDHIETLCEIDIEYRKAANDVGITDFRMTKAIECHDDFIKALADCAIRSLDAK